MSQFPQVEGWQIEKPHRVSGGGGCNADSLPHYRVFAIHNECRSVVTIIGGTEAECIGNIVLEIREFEEKNGVGIKLPSGWNIDFVQMTAGGKVCSMKASRGTDVVTAIGVSRLDARLRLIEEICNNRTITQRMSQAETLLKTYNDGA